MHRCIPVTLTEFEGKQCITNNMRMDYGKVIKMKIRKHLNEL